MSIKSILWRIIGLCDHCWRIAAVERGQTTLGAYSSWMLLICDKCKATQDRRFPCDFDLSKLVDESAGKPDDIEQLLAAHGGNPDGAPS